MSLGTGRGDHTPLREDQIVRVRVQLDRQSRRWSWASLPAEDTPPERSPIDFPTAQAAIVDAQDRIGPGLTVIV